MRRDRPDMWDALARRDIGAVYRLLCAAGMTQAEIAARTNQSQFEVSAIMAGRQVMSYALLERIAGAFGIPRGHLGLGYAPGDEPTKPASEEDERGRVLAHAAKVTLGWPAFGEPDEAPWFTEKTPPPHRVSPADVEQLGTLTARLAVLEQRSGGGVVLPAIQAQIRASRPQLDLASEDTAARAVHRRRRAALPCRPCACSSSASRWPCRPTCHG